MADPQPEVAIAELIERHYRWIYRYAYRLSGSAADAEDLTQQTFLVAQTKLDQLRDPGVAAHWLCAIVRNGYLKSVRRTLRPVSLEVIPEPTCEPACPAEIDPEQLQAALNELPDEFRIPLVLFYFEDCSYKEIAEQLEVPIGTVMSRLSRAKAHVRQRLAPREVTGPALPPPRVPRTMVAS